MTFKHFRYPGWERRAAIAEYQKNPEHCEICQGPMLYGRVQQGAKTCSKMCHQEKLARQRACKL